MHAVMTLTRCSSLLLNVKVSCLMGRQSLVAVKGDIILEHLHCS
jgi:hypothetical protein